MYYKSNIYRKKFIILIALINLISTYSGTALADRNMKTAITLQLSTIIEFKPFIWNDETGIRGIDYDIIKEMCRRMGLKCNIKFQPWKRVLFSIENGKSSGGFSGFIIS